MWYFIVKFFFSYVNYRMPPRGGKSSKPIDPETLKLGKIAMYMNPDDYKNLRNEEKGKYENAYKETIKYFNELQNPNRPQISKGIDYAYNPMESATMGLVKVDEKGNYMIPEKGNVIGEPLFSKEIVALLANSNFVELAGKPLSEFSKGIDTNLMAMRSPIIDSNVADYNANNPTNEHGKYTTHKIYEQLNNNLKTLAGGRKMKGGANEAVIPELAKGSNENKALMKEVTDYDKKDIFSALPENVIRMSLIEDVLMIDDDKSVIPKVQITTAPFNFASGPILFYDPLCPNCKSLAPSFIKMANMLRGKCPVGVVDCLDRMNGNDILKDYLGITGYPVIKVYSKGKFIDYTGGADLKKMLSFVCTATGVCLE